MLRTNPYSALILLTLLSGCAGNPASVTPDENGAPPTNDTATPPVSTEAPLTLDKATAQPQDKASAAPIRPAPAFEDQSEYASAQQALSAQHYDEAVKTLSALVQKYPRRSGPQANLGIAYLQLGELDKAQEALSRALALNDKVAATQAMLGLVYRKQGKIKLAQQHYQAALALDANYALAHYNLAVLNEIYLQDDDQALIHYKRYLQLNGTPDTEVEKWISRLEKRNR